MSKTKQRTKIQYLTDAERGRFDEWADKWIEIGLRTGDADRARFEQAVCTCYRYTNIPPPKVIVWTTSPLAIALAGPIADFLLKQKAHTMMREAVCEAVEGAVDGAVREAVREDWNFYFGGQFWVGGYWWGPAFTSFFRDVCGLALPGNLWKRGLAYEATVESACWWWPHREFVMISERPVTIHRELRNPSRPRGLDSHRLHHSTHAAVSFRDGWSIYASHGVRVPPYVILHPETMNPSVILKEQNAEVRRVMIERFGLDRFLVGVKAKAIDNDEKRTLYKIALPDDETIVAVKVQCPSTGQIYFLRVPPQITRCDQAVAWTFGFEKVKEYQPLVET